MHVSVVLLVMNAADLHQRCGIAVRTPCIGGLIAVTLLAVHTWNASARSVVLIVDSGSTIRRDVVEVLANSPRRGALAVIIIQIDTIDDPRLRLIESGVRHDPGQQHSVEPVRTSHLTLQAVTHPLLPVPGPLL